MASAAGPPTPRPPPGARSRSLARRRLSPRSPSRSGPICFRWPARRPLTRSTTSAVTGGPRRRTPATTPSTGSTTTSATGCSTARCPPTTVSCDRALRRTRRVRPAKRVRRLVPFVHVEDVALSVAFYHHLGFAVESVYHYRERPVW